MSSKEVGVGDDTKSRWMTALVDGVAVFVLFSVQRWSTTFVGTGTIDMEVRTHDKRMSRSRLRFCLNVPICPGSRRTDADRNLKGLLYSTHDVTECPQAQCRLDASLHPYPHTSSQPFLCLLRLSSPLKLSCHTSAIVALYCSTPSCAHSVSETVLIPTNTLSPDEGSLLTGTA